MSAPRAAPQRTWAKPKAAPFRRNITGFNIGMMANEITKGNDDRKGKHALCSGSFAGFHGWRLAGDVVASKTM